MELRITFDPSVMGGKPCICGVRVTTGTLVGSIAEVLRNPSPLGLSVSGGVRHPIGAEALGVAS